MTKTDDGAEDIIGKMFAAAEARLELDDFNQRVKEAQTSRRRFRSAGLWIAVLIGGVIAALFGGRLFELVGSRLDFPVVNTNGLLLWTLLLLSAGVVLEIVLEAFGDAATASRGSTSTRRLG